MTLIYDTGGLVAAERRDRRVSALHDECLQAGLIPIVPATVLAQGWRGVSNQAGLASVLAGCGIDVLDEERARAVGVLAGTSAMADVVDVSVVECAVRHRGAVVTSNQVHIEHIARMAGTALRVEQV
jgi:hypothetical protein